MSTAMIFVPASDLAVGDAVVEADGGLLAVMSIERHGAMVTARLASDFSPVAAWRSNGSGVSLRKRASTKVAVMRGEGWQAVPSLPRPVVTSEQIRDAVLAITVEGGAASITGVALTTGADFAVVQAEALAIVAEGTIERWQVVQ
jgi:hypothetical protein